jgi:acyl carrier protein
MPFFDRFKKKSEISPEKRQELFDKIVGILTETLEIDKEITLESRITEDLGADSLETVELVMALEEKLNIEIPDEDAEKMKTIDDVIIYLANRLKEQKY